MLAPRRAHMRSNVGSTSGQLLQNRFSSFNFVFYRYFVFKFVEYYSTYSRKIMPNMQYCTNEVPHHTFGIMVLHCMSGYSKTILFLVGFEFRLCIFKRCDVNVQ